MGGCNVPPVMLHPDVFALIRAPTPNYHEGSVVHGFFCSQEHVAYRRMMMMVRLNLVLVPCCQSQYPATLSGCPASNRSIPLMNSSSNQSHEKPGMSG